MSFNCGFNNQNERKMYEYLAKHHTFALDNHHSVTQ